MSDKRKGSMSDDERALEHLKHRPRTPALGVPVNEFGHSKHDFTPVSEVIERIERTIVLDDRDRLLIHLFWEHTANMTMRWAQTEPAKLDARLDEVERSLVDIAGKNGNNGKVGTLKERLDKAEARRWWALTFIAGLIVTIVGSAYSFGSRIGALETEVDVLKQRRARNVSPPDYPATKEGPQP